MTSVVVLNHMQASESGNEDRKQLELLAKIQALSAQLKPEYREKVNLKRKQPSLQSSSRVDEGTFLVPATPSPSELAQSYMQSSSKVDFG